MHSFLALAMKYEIHTASVANCFECKNENNEQGIYLLVYPLYWSISIIFASLEMHSRPSGSLHVRSLTMNPIFCLVYPIMISSFLIYAECSWYLADNFSI